MNNDTIIYDLIDMKNWRVKEDILNELSNMGKDIDERYLRFIFENNNNLFNEHERSLYIVHSKYGYKATDSELLIVQSITDLKKRAFNMLKKYYKTCKAIKERKNVRFKL